MHAVGSGIMADSGRLEYIISHRLFITLHNGFTLLQNPNYIQVFKPVYFV